MSDYKSKVFKSHHKKNKQLIKEARSKIKDQMNAFKSNYKKFNSLLSFVQSNKLFEEKELIKEVFCKIIIFIIQKIILNH